ncbi:heavy metal translocating P-type ATPase [Porticoccus sp.]
MTPISCYHCGLPVPPEANFTLEIDGQPRPMCCPGCLAVATAICDGGLARFYQYRTGNAERPEEIRADLLAAYDLPDVQCDYLEQLDNGDRQIQLLVGGISCSACAWLIEKHLQKLPGISGVQVNVTSHRALVSWNPALLKLSRLLGALQDIGYDPRPVTDEAVRQLRDRENRRFMQRLGVAGLGMMQAGMVAVGLYAGAFQDMDPVWQNYLRWVSLIIALPVVSFSAFPFYQAAWRSLRQLHLSMDVPVSLAIILAFSASCWATLMRTGEVYFDSVSMFTFFILVGRYLEMRVRHRNDMQAEALGQLLPVTACRLDGESELRVPVKALQTGDLIRVSAGDTIPCDGEIERGRSSVVEAVLTGEQLPVGKRMGDSVSAGTVNSENPLVIRVAAVGNRTRLSAILRLVEKARSEKPVQVALADQLAGYFVGAVLLIAVAVGWWWWQHQPEQALWVVLSVLVVTCPCALSLATPAAIAVATGALRQRGFLISRGQILDVLSRVDQLVFDKTGTLTLGNMRVAAVIPLAEQQAPELLSLAAAFEVGSRHPIARAFEGVRPSCELSDIDQRVGAGVCARRQGMACAIGQPHFVAEQLGFANPPLPALAPGQLPLLLGEGTRPLGWILLQDQLRPGAQDAVARLQQQSVEVVLLSGDRAEAVADMAAKLGIREAHGALTPGAKLAWVNCSQRLGRRVVMVGDGINDVPVLSGADASVALGDASDFARIHADSILLSGNLCTLPDAVSLARRTRVVILQNLGWAVCYNLLALPLAACGLVPPWAAAIGMSTSSLLVVANALRLGRNKRAELAVGVPDPCATT